MVARPLPPTATREPQRHAVPSRRRRCAAATARAGPRQGLLLMELPSCSTASLQPLPPSTPPPQLPTPSPPHRRGPAKEWPPPRPAAALAASSAASYPGPRPPARRHSFCYDTTNLTSSTFHPGAGSVRWREGRRGMVVLRAVRAQTSRDGDGSRRGSGGVRRRGAEERTRWWRRWWRRRRGCGCGWGRRRGGREEGRREVARR